MSPEMMPGNWIVLHRDNLSDCFRRFAGTVEEILLKNGHFWRFNKDVNQIDTPYLDENSNGLAYLVDRLRGEPLFAHVQLEKGERSELANLANDLL